MCIGTYMSPFDKGIPSLRHAHALAHMHYVCIHTYVCGYACVCGCMQYVCDYEDVRLCTCMHQSVVWDTSAVHTDYFILPST